MKAKTIISVAICVITASLSSLGDLLHPDVLLMPDGTRITTAKEWCSKARPQILDFFEKNVYGKIPPRSAALRWSSTVMWPHGMPTRRTGSTRLRNRTAQAVRPQAQ